VLEWDNFHNMGYDRCLATTGTALQLHRCVGARDRGLALADRQLMLLDCVLTLLLLDMHLAGCYASSRFLLFASQHKSVPLCCLLSPLHVPACADVFMRHQPIIGLALAAAAAITTEGPAGNAPPPATLWERLATYERQLLLTLPDGTQGRQMLVDVLLQAVQAASPDQVCRVGRWMSLANTLQHYWGNCT
jgi:hypothetical protein